MRTLKLLGLSLTTALGIAAVLGASSASAGSTQLCATQTLPCTHLALLIHLVAKNARISTSLVTITCLEALILGTALALAAPQILHGEFAFTHCLTGGGTSCEVTGGLSLFEVLKTSKETGTFAFTGEFNATCGKLINCTYGGEELLGHALGPEKSGGNGSVTYNSANLKSTEGFLCPMFSQLTAKFEHLFATYLSS